MATQVNAAEMEASRSVYRTPVGARIVAIAIGMIFALFVSRETSPVAALLAGIVIGIALWAAMGFYVLPQMNPTMAARIALMPLGYFAAHILFGIGLAMSPAFMRMFVRERPDRVRVHTQQILPI